MAKKEEGKELLENPELIKEKLEGIEHWAERNPKIIIGIVSVLVLIVGGYFGWKYYIDCREAEAQKEMFQAVHYFESDSLNLALNGDGNHLGFLQVFDEHGMTPARNLVKF